jgi:hypothetical protein
MVLQKEVGEDSQGNQENKKFKMTSLKQMWVLGRIFKN